MRRDWLTQNATDFTALEAEQVFCSSHRFVIKARQDENVMTPFKPSANWVFLIALIKLKYLFNIILPIFSGGSIFHERKANAIPV